MMNKKPLAPGFSILFLLILCSPTGAQTAQTADLQPGVAAPEVGLEKLLQAPAGARADLKSLRGKVVVLEFWATWCAPCIALQPHLNQLAEKFKEKPIQFISITDEDEAIVAPFLARRTLKGWVGLDLDRSVHTAYGINALPKTVIIGPTGKIAAITRANQLNEEMLNQLLAANQSASSEAPANRQIASAPAETKAPETEQALLEISIRASKAARTTLTMLRPGVKQYKATSASLRQILMAALGVHPSRESRITIPAELQGQRFDVTAGLSEGKTENLRAVMVNALENALGIRVKRITREMEAYVFTAPKGLAGLTGSLRPSKAKTFHASGDKGVNAAVAADLSFLEIAIEMALKTPAVDETGLQGKFDWDLLYDGDNPKSMIEAIRKEFGLEITLAKRHIEFFIVEK